MVFSSLDIAIHRTRDMELVKRLSMRDDIFALIRDDGAINNAAKRNFINSNNRYYLIPYIFPDDCPPTPTGLIIYYPLNHVLYEGHIFIYPEYQHQATVEVGHKANRWLFENSPAQKIIALVSVNKPHVLKLVQKAGFRQEGFLPRSVLLNGELVDQYLYAIEKQDYE
jgi:RimJ/RimL family protein N-acetyltransferase